MTVRRAVSRVRLRGGGAAALLVLMAIAPPAVAAPPPDRTGTVTPQAVFEWTGPTTTASNQTFDPEIAEPCGKLPSNYCDVTLVNVVPGDFYSLPGRGISFSTQACPAPITIRPMIE